MKNLNLGCGKIHKKEFINIDIQQPADLILRVGKDKLPYEDSSIDRIEADNLMEHLDNDEFIFAMNECWRVLKSDGQFWFKSPDALRNFNLAFGDPTHKRYFTDKSFQFPIGRGGMILTDDEEASKWFKLARFDGRDEIPLQDQKDITVVGFNAYMTPEQALRGLELFETIKNKDLPDLDVTKQNYPDLSKYEIYK